MMDRAKDGSMIWPPKCFSQKLSMVVSTLLLNLDELTQLFVSVFIVLNSAKQYVEVFCVEAQANCSNSH